MKTDTADQPSVSVNLWFVIYIYKMMKNKVEHNYNPMNQKSMEYYTTIMKK